MPAATNRNGLIQNVKKAWSAISPDTLNRLICGMPDRVKKCLRMKGQHIGK